jgi:hypothetical protein
MGKFIEHKIGVRMPLDQRAAVRSTRTYFNAHAIQEASPHIAQHRCSIYRTAFLHRRSVRIVD